MTREGEREIYIEGGREIYIESRGLERERVTGVFVHLYWHRNGRPTAVAGETVS